MVVIVGEEYATSLSWQDLQCACRVFRTLGFVHLSHGSKVGNEHLPFIPHESLTLFYLLVLQDLSNNIKTFTVCFEMLLFTFDFVAIAGLGFHIKGGVDERDHSVITISTISELGSAAADGRLKVGDCIIAVSTNTIPCFHK